MNFELLHPAEQISTIFDRICGQKMTFTPGASISVLDEKGNIWITPKTIRKVKLSPEDVLCEKSDQKNPDEELLLHMEIYKSRPGIKSIIHSYPPASLGFGIKGRLPDIRLIPKINLLCGEIAITDNLKPGSQEAAKAVAEKFAEGFSTVLSGNNGLVLGSKSLFVAYEAMETFEHIAKMEIFASKVGDVKPMTEKEIEYSNQKVHTVLDEFVPKLHTSEEKLARKEMIQIIRESYQREYFTCCQGTYSTRLPDNSFLITPYRKDRKYLEEEDLVLVNDKKKEKGKFPSRSVDLHIEIYERNPEIGAVFVAHPANIMAFAVSDAEFESKIIPESHIWLREVKEVPFGYSFRKKEETAEILSGESPVLICSNDCVIVTGENMGHAFNRLEILEYSAMAVWGSKDI